MKNKNVHRSVIYNGEKRRIGIGSDKLNMAEPSSGISCKDLSVVSDMFFVTWEKPTKKFMFRKIPNALLLKPKYICQSRHLLKQSKEEIDKLVKVATCELIEFFDDFERITLAFSSTFCTLFFLLFYASQCVGFSLWWLLSLYSTGFRYMGSVVAVRGFSCSSACGIFPNQIELLSPTLAAGLLTTGK